MTDREQEPTRAEKMREAGYTRRPSLREFPSDKPAREEQEPVAWQWLDTGTFRKSLPASAEPGAWTPLYTAPQRREWLGLTDEEIEQACVPLGAAMLSFTEVARAIEAKLKEKNT